MGRYQVPHPQLRDPGQVTTALCLSPLIRERTEVTVIAESARREGSVSESPQRARSIAWAAASMDSSLFCFSFFPGPQGRQAHRRGWRVSVSRKEGGQRRKRRQAGCLNPQPRSPAPAPVGTPAALHRSLSLGPPRPMEVSPRPRVLASADLNRGQGRRDHAHFYCSAGGAHAWGPSLGRGPDS